MYCNGQNYKEETKKIADELSKRTDTFIAMYNSNGEVKTQSFIKDDDFNFTYDGLIPFVKDIIANYFIFNDFSNTTLIIMDGDILSEIEFENLEDLRLFYLAEI